MGCKDISMGQPGVGGRRGIDGQGCSCHRDEEDGAESGLNRAWRRMQLGGKTRRNLSESKTGIVDLAHLALAFSGWEGSDEHCSRKGHAATGLANMDSSFMVQPTPDHFSHDHSRLARVITAF